MTFKSIYLLNKKSKIIKRVILFIFIIPIVLALLVLNLLNVWVTLNFDLSLINIVCLSSLITILTISNIIYNIIKNHYKNVYINEFKEMINNVSLPSKLPKVVYVYTTHNDFMPSRMLQNMQQTYSNIEYWISDGSSNAEISAKIKEFAAKNKINYHSMKRPSTNKADNLNHFLQYSGCNFDYLLIADADTAFDKKFVKNAVKVFYSNVRERLGYVTASLMCYRGYNLYTNSLCYTETILYLNKIYENFSPRITSLCSAGCLLSKEMLKDIDFKFDTSNLEDWCTEKLVSKKMWQGYVLPTNIAMMAFDKSIWQHLNRMSRVFSWSIKYLKEDCFKNFNHYFRGQNFAEQNNLLYGFYFCVGFIIGTFFIWQLVVNGTNNNYFGLILIITLLINAFIRSFAIAIINRAMMSKLDFWMLHIFKLIYFIVIIPYYLKVWFGALFLSKYISFDKKNKFNLNTKSKTLLTLMWFIIFSTLIVIFNFLMFKWLPININDMWIYLCVVVNSVIGYGVLFCLSLLTLIGAGKVKQNKDFSDDKFVYCNFKYSSTEEEGK